MTKDVAVIGTTEFFRNQPKNIHSAGNAGNMLHARAARRIVRNTREMVNHRLWTEAEIEALREQSSHILFVGANGVAVNKQHSSREPHQRIMAQNIRAAGLPVVVLGLGAQSPNNAPEGDIFVPDGTLELLRACSDHAVSIGVRGAFTRRVLMSVGISNVTVLGCQTCFMSYDPEFAEHFDTPSVDGPDGLVANYTFPLVEKHLIQLIHKYGIDVVGQEEFYEYFLANDLPTTDVAELKRAHRLRAALDDRGISMESYVAFLREHFRQYEDIDLWRKDMKRYRFSFGTRFHGNMAALQSGVPALWLTHDARTIEMCNYLGLPNMPARKLRADMPLTDLAARCDFAKFRERYRANYLKMKSFLDEAGLQHQLA